MKTPLSYFAIALISFAAGYLVNPILNSDNHITTKTPSNKSKLEVEQATVQQQEQMNSNSSTVTTANHSTKGNLDSVTTVESKSSTGSKAELIDLIETPPENTAAKLVTPAQIRELREWASKHKAELNDLINTHVPNHIAEDMLNMVTNNNEFLTQPAVKQDPAVDSNWAFNTEQELRSYIENHPESTNFDLISVSCKQLKCDVLGIEKQAQSWIKIFFSMFKNLPNVNPPDSSGDTNSFSFLNGDDTTSIYYQLKFKPS